LSVIVPIYKNVGEDMEEFIVTAVKDIPEEIDVILSTTKELEEYVKEHAKTARRKNLKVLGTKTDNYQKLINAAVSDEYEWFTVLEYYDDFMSNVFKNFLVESEYKSDVSVFMELQQLEDYQTKKFIRYGNEAPWASSFSEEIGYLDKECLESYYDFFMSGAIINVKDWKYVGGLKESMQYVYWHEFLMRTLQNGKKVFVMPKLGYKHRLDYADAHDNVDIDEKDFNAWMDLAKEEYLYKKDRGKKPTVE
jgi:hypothetical protein